MLFDGASANRLKVSLRSPVPLSSCAATCGRWCPMVCTCVVSEAPKNVQARFHPWNLLLSREIVVTCVSVKANTRVLNSPFKLTLLETECEWVRDHLLQRRICWKDRLLMMHYYVLFLRNAGTSIEWRRRMVHKWKMTLISTALAISGNCSCISCRLPLVCHANRLLVHFSTSSSLDKAWLL